MAGDWIKMRSDLFTHPKVVRMASALKADTLRTVGGLMSAWCLFDAHSVDGRLDGYTPATLDDHLRWPGFAAAMIGVKWLLATSDETGGSLGLPEFDTHNGQSAKRRAQDADRKKELRKASASDADKKRTREEKRREETTRAKAPRSPHADADSWPVEVVDANGVPTNVEVNTADALAVVMACRALRRLGMLDVQPQRPELLALVARGTTTEQMALTAAELTLRKARKAQVKCLNGLDPEPHPELLELFASGATAEQMYLRPAELAELKNHTPKLEYLAATLIGRANDNANQGESHAKVQSGRRESVAERAERFAREGDERDAEREARDITGVCDVAGG